MCIPLEGLFQNLKERPKFVVGSDTKRLNAAILPVRRLMSLMFDGGNISSTAFILYGFASIPRLLTIKPKNFQAETPKAHLAGFSFIF